MDKIIHLTGDYGIDRALTPIIEILQLLNEGLENSFREPDKAYIYYGKIRQKIKDLKENK